MSQAYTPGLEVTAKTRISKIRELPLVGTNLVSVGDRVTADQSVLEAQLPGDLQVIRVADRMGLEPIDVVDSITVKDGDVIARGDLLCETKTFFGMFTSRLESPVGGEIEFFTGVNAHLGVRLPSIPLTVNAYIDGTITQVDEGKSVTIETSAALIQGIFGVGGERMGTIHPLSVPNDSTVEVADIEALGESIKGAILIGGADYSSKALGVAAHRGASAIVTGSIDAETLRDYVGFEIGVSITGDEEVPCTVIVTEGFGQLAISPRITELANSLSGRSASVSGATQVRAGAMRPEIIVPHPAQGDAMAETTELHTLSVGSRIRVIRVPYFGQFGTVSELPHEPFQIPSGAHVRVLKAQLDDGREAIVPRANVELV